MESGRSRIPWLRNAAEGFAPLWGFNASWARAAGRCCQRDERREVRPLLKRTLKLGRKSCWPSCWFNDYYDLFPVLSHIELFFPGPSDVRNVSFVGCVLNAHFTSTRHEDQGTVTSMLSPWNNNRMVRVMIAQPLLVERVISGTTAVVSISAFPIEPHPEERRRQRFLIPPFPLYSASFPYLRSTCVYALTILCFAAPSPPCGNS